MFFWTQNQTNITFWWTELGVGKWELEKSRLIFKFPVFELLEKSLFKIFNKKQSCEIKGQQLIEGLEIWEKNGNG